MKVFQNSITDRPRNDKHTEEFLIFTRGTVYLFF